jgi:hypothetical protein
MTFEDIKAGDIVYTYDHVRTGWTRIKKFMVPKKVARTTKTLIILENGKRFKKNGLEYGSGYDSISLTGTDESNEMKAFINKVNLVKEANDLLYNFKVYTDMDSNLINELITLLKKIQTDER